MPGDFFFLTTGLGTVEVLSYPSLKPLDTLTAHTAGCYCIAIDPKGRYFAVGSADSLVSLWDISDMLCLRTFTKLEWPVRTISFNYSGEYIASASEDLFIDIANVQTGRTVHQIPCRAAMNSVEWNPKYNLLAYAGDDKNPKYNTDEGVFRIFGFESS
jgi:THO complex subunit 3